MYIYIALKQKGRVKLPKMKRVRVKFRRALFKNRTVKVVSLLLIGLGTFLVLKSTRRSPPKNPATWSNLLERLGVQVIKSECMFFIADVFIGIKIANGYWEYLRRRTNVFEPIPPPKRF